MFLFFFFSTSPPQPLSRPLPLLLLWNLPLPGGLNDKQTNKQMHKQTNLQDPGMLPLRHVHPGRVRLLSHLRQGLRRDLWWTFPGRYIYHHVVLDILWLDISFRHLEPALATCVAWDSVSARRTPRRTASSPSPTRSGLQSVSENDLVQGETYNKCTNAGSENGAAWCATEVKSSTFAASLHK